MINIIRASVFLVLLSIGSYSNAQECKYTETEYPTIGGKFRKSINTSIGKGNNLTFNIIENNYTISISTIFIDQKRELRLKKGDSLIINLSSEISLILFAIADVKPLSQGLNYRDSSYPGEPSFTATFYESFYNVSQEQIKILSEYQVNLISVYFSKKLYNIKVKKKKSIKIINAADCFLKNY